MAGEKSGCELRCQFLPGERGPSGQYETRGRSEWPVAQGGRGDFVTIDRGRLRPTVESDEDEDWPTSKIDWGEVASLALVGGGYEGPTERPTWAELQDGLHIDQLTDLHETPRVEPPPGLRERLRRAAHGRMCQDRSSPATMNGPFRR